jgi:PPP family 3-phenylpropionic acid transporter
MRKIWPFSFYFVFFGAVAAFIPYLVLYYQSLSFTGAQIGLLVGIPPLATVVSIPLITGLADRTNRHRLVMSTALLLVALGLVVLPTIEAFILLLVMAILVATAFSSAIPLSDSATMFMLGDRKDLYGRIRLGGTFGFAVVATVVGTLVESYGLKIAFWGAGVLFCMAFLIGQKLDHGEEVIETSTGKAGTGELLKNPRFLVFLLLGFAGGASFAALNTFLFPYMEDLGAGESLMGVALTIGTITEIPVMIYVGRFIKRWGPYTVANVAIAAMGLRLLLLGIAPTPTFVLFTQLLNGFNFAPLAVAGVTYADTHAPKGFRATAQGLFNAAMGGIGSATGGFLGGPLFDGVGAKGMYLIFCLSLVVVLVFVGLVNRSLPPEPAPVAPSI